MTAPLQFSTGYSDCVTCMGAGLVFTDDDVCVSCPECDRRDAQFEEVINLDNFSHRSR